MKPVMNAWTVRLEMVKPCTVPLMVTALVSPTLHTLAPSSASLAALMEAQLLLSSVSLNRFTVTLHCLLAGAV